MLLFDFSSLVGIEIVPGLHEQAEEVIGKLVGKIGGKRPSLICGSILEENWADGDIIFANSTCFDESLMKAIAEKAVRLRPGSIIITFTKPLPEVCQTDETLSTGAGASPFKIIDKTSLKMSWGPATVYTHIRVGPDGDLGDTIPAKFNEWHRIAGSVSTSDALKTLGIDISVNSTIFAIDNNNTLDQQRRLIEDLQSSVVTPGTNNECILRFENHKKGHQAFIKYILHVPTDWNSTNYVHRPILVFLHGSSARGENLDSMRKYAIPLYADIMRSPNEVSHEDQSFVEQVTRSESVKCLLDNFIIISPLCPSGIEWKSEAMDKAVMTLVDYVCDRLSARRKVCFTGISMGGLGAYMISAKHADRVACAIPICGGGSPVFARLLKSSPM